MHNVPKIDKIQYQNINMNQKITAVKCQPHTMRVIVDKRKNTGLILLIYEYRKYYIWTQK